MNLNFCSFQMTMEVKIDKLLSMATRGVFLLNFGMIV